MLNSSVPPPRFGESHWDETLNTYSQNMHNLTFWTNADDNKRAADIKIPAGMKLWPESNFAEYNQIYTYGIRGC